MEICIKVLFIPLNVEHIRIVKSEYLDTQDTTHGLFNSVFKFEKATTNYSSFNRKLQLELYVYLSDIV